LAQAARRSHHLDQVVLVLPQTLPHKGFEGANFEQRVSLLKAAANRRPGWAAASARGGLFKDIAAEFRQICGPAVEIFLLCGRDAATRVVAWDYGPGPSIVEQLREFRIVVASRRGEYEPPPEISSRILSVDLDEELQKLSSSEVRDALASGRPWRHMVPPAVARLIDEQGLYR
jgi:nicotinic acid mononucleotide adenylyltransferase